MLKIKSQIKTLGLVIGLGLLSGTASAITLHSTTDFITSEGASFDIGDWGAARFGANTANCPNGCEVDDATLAIFDDGIFFPDEAPLAGLSLSVYSDGGDGKSLGTKMFSFNTPASIGAGILERTFGVKDGEDSFLSNNTYYWLRLDNDGRSDGIQWMYDGFAEGEYQLSSESGTFHDFPDLPFIFEVNGTPSPVPVPGAVWMMGSGLFGLLAVSRRKPNKQA